MQTINERVQLVVNELYNGNVSEFERACGIKPYTIKNIVSGRLTKPSYDVLELIVRNNVQISAEWLLRGIGDMETHSTEQTPAYTYQEEYFHGGAPYYAELAASAGETGGIEPAEEIPSGYINIPGVSAIAYFPVEGLSMQPEIQPRDTIAIANIDSWDRVDPDKIYFIITDSERMIKRLRIDEDKKDRLYCVSPNYKEFPIMKSEIKAIYRVVFAGRLV